MYSNIQKRNIFLKTVFSKNLTELLHIAVTIMVNYVL